jgi:signal transduction histidine kinase
VVDDLDGTIREIRSVIFGLQSLGGTSPGLGDEIMLIASEAGTHLASRPSVKFEGPLDAVRAEIAAQLVPTLREALSNVARHAQASSVEITVDVGEDIVLCVGDDGVGIGEQR